MNKFILILSVLLCFISLDASKLLELKGQLKQGGLLIGTVSDSIEAVFYDYNKIEITQKKFIIGFDRDEKLNHLLTIVHQNGKMFSKKIKLQKREYDVQEINKVAEKYVAQPKNQELLKRIARESSILKKARAEIFQKDSLLISQFFWPIDGGRISGVYGSQRILNGVPKRPHSGLDIAAAEGTPVKAMSSGKVALTGSYYYNGNFVLLNHGGGLSSIYIHLSEISVYDGDLVQAGDKIGEVGSTGRSTGPHLHWGINLGSKRIDPELILQTDEAFFRLRRAE